jgi:hypothetical protein
MAEIDTSSAINQIHGKTNGKDSGYFYMRNGKQFYRTREETYQQHQSRKQEYNSKVFAYANAQMAQNYGTPEGKIRLAAEYEAAHHIGSSGKTYGTPWSWKFNSLQYEYRQSHPFEP